MQTKIQNKTKRAEEAKNNIENETGNNKDKYINNEIKTIEVLKRSTRGFPFMISECSNHIEQFFSLIKMTCKINIYICIVIRSIIYI